MAYRTHLLIGCYSFEVEIANSFCGYFIAKMNFKATFFLKI